MIREEYSKLQNENRTQRKGPASGSKSKQNEVYYDSNQRVNKDYNAEDDYWYQTRSKTE